MAEFYSSTYGNLTLLPGLPENFEGPFLKGSNQRYLQLDAGIIVLQELQNDQFSLQLMFFQLLKKITLATRIAHGFQSLFFHSGEAKIVLPDRGKLLVRPSQFLLFNSGPGELQIQPSIKTPLHILNASFDLSLLEELVPAFPSMEEFLKGKKTVTLKPLTAHAEIRDAVHQILYAGYGPSSLPFYLKAKVSEYLFLILDHATAPKTSALQPSEWEITAVHKVRDLILKDILEHLHISELAAKVKMDRFRLQVFFKREFGVGPYEFLLNARMDKVRELMEAGFDFLNGRQLFFPAKLKIGQHVFIKQLAGLVHIDGFKRQGGGTIAFGRPRWGPASGILHT